MAVNTKHEKAKDKTRDERIAEHQARVAAEAPANESPQTVETRKPKEKKPKVQRVTYPGLQPDAEGKATVKLTEWPKDHDPNVHEPLWRQHFEDERVWLRHKIAEREEALNAMKRELQLLDTTGGKEVAKLAVKMDKMRQAFEAQRANLVKLYGQEKADEMLAMILSQAPKAKAQEEGDGSKASS